MNSNIPFKLIFLLALLVTVVSVGGIFFPATYLRETAEWRAQSIGQDWFDLLISVPTLLVSAILCRRGSLTAFYFLLGVLIFLIYTLIIYTFAVPFNQLFLVYCIALGAASYNLIYLLWQTESESIKNRIAIGNSTAVATIYLVIFAVLFYALWLSQVVPAILSGHPPLEVVRMGLLTNPVHVLDLSLLLPGFLITAFLLRRGHSLGYLFAPTIMTFSVIMTLSIATLVLYEYCSGIGSDYSVAIAMGVSSMLSALVFRRFLRVQR